MRTEAEWDKIKSEFKGLSCRAWNACTSRKLHTKKAAKAAIIRRDLTPEKCYNYGPKTHKELCIFLNIPYIDPQPKRVICPHCKETFPWKNIITT